MASVGQITGTQVHSGPKHILQCNVSEDVLRMLATEDTRERVHRDKMLYCMHKHELALCCSIPYNINNNMMFKQKTAYPPVVTTLGFIDVQTKNLIRAVYNTQTVEDFEESRQNIIDRAAGNPNFKFHFPQFTFQGVAQTQAWATSNFGDTIGSVLVAGFATVMNGHFHAYTGDVVHWYFDFESIMFEEDGKRRRNGNFNSNPANVNAITEANPNFYDANPIGIGEKAGERKDYHEMREYGNYPELYKNLNRANGSREYKQNIIYPKPYLYDGCGYGDRIRVFGRVVNGGRPFEPIDVLIYSQCR